MQKQTENTHRASSTFTHTRSHKPFVCLCAHFKATLLIKKKTNPRNYSYYYCYLSRFKWTLQCLLVISHKKYNIKCTYRKEYTSTIINKTWQWYRKMWLKIHVHVLNTDVSFSDISRHTRPRFFFCTQTRSDTPRSPEFILIPTTHTRIWRVKQPYTNMLQGIVHSKT